MIDHLVDSVFVFVPETVRSLTLWSLHFPIFLMLVNIVVSQESVTKEQANASGETEDADKMKERPLLWEHAHNNVCAWLDEHTLLRKLE